MEPWFLQNHTGRLNILTAMLLIIIGPGILWLFKNNQMIRTT
ncbi:MULTISPECIES: hypothetical protein [unclassified Neisseria]|nr:MULTISPECIES: hypothetical protein [unclassified Neisseria]